MTREEVEDMEEHSLASFPLQYFSLHDQEEEEEEEG